MEYISVASTAVLVYITFYLTKKYIQRSRYNGIPGPKPLPVIGVTHKIKDLKKLHLLLQQWSQEYGSMIYMPVISGPSVVVSDYEGIYEVAIKKGMECGGRHAGFRITYVLKETGILSSANPDAKWKSLRKASQKSLKQYGTGMEDLENVILDISEDMFTMFRDQQGKSCDPYECIIDTTLKIITTLIVGQKSESGDKLTNLMRRYERDFTTYFGPLAHPKYMLLDFFPWIRHFGYKPWTRDILQMVQVAHNIWHEVKRIIRTDSGSQGLVKTMLEHVGTDFDEADVHGTTLNLLVAGVMTTSNTFYAAINILAHKQDIQTKIRDEIESICSSHAVSIKDRKNMPYTQAFLYELLRYTSVVPLSISHRATVDTTIKGFKIPKDTRIMMNLYHMHHDPAFWSDPDEFTPERFLDDSGDVVPADHPNRQHLMPFGAGPRVCLGENLALARIFLWVATLVKRIRVIPDEDNHPDTINPKNSTFDIILRPAAYKIQFTELE